MLSDPIRQGEDLAQRCEELRREILRMQNIAGGPGIRVSSTAGGIAIRSVTQAPTPSGAPSTSGGTKKALAQTQGTVDNDAWNPVNVSEDKGKFPEFQLVTDLKYDLTTHKLTYRTRTCTCDRAGHLKLVSTEGELVEITTAEELAGT